MYIQSTSQILLKRILYTTHDSEDLCYFGIVIITQESLTGYKLCAYKAEMKIVLQYTIRYTTPKYAIYDC